MSDKLSKTKERKTLPVWLPWLIALILLAVALRVGIWLTYQPVETSDSEGYKLMAHLLYTRSWQSNLGARPPAYPALMTTIAMSKYGLNERIIWGFQAGLGTLGAVLWFALAWRATHNAPLAFAAGLLNAFNLSAAYFESMIMSEALSAFLILLMLIAAGILGKKQSIGPARSILLGTLIGIAALTRPILLYFAGVCLLYLWWTNTGESIRRRILLSFAYLIPTAVLVLGWSWVNWKTVHYFGVTTMTGFNLINHAGSFIEDAPEEYAVVRDIYLEYRAERIAETGNQSMTIWRAMPEISETTGLNYIYLSRLFTDISVDLILSHPFQYLQSVARAWVGFWKVPNYWRMENIQPANLVPLLKSVWNMERISLIAINFIFLTSGFYWFFRWRKKTLTKFEASLGWGYAIVLLGSIGQALLDIGENPRYGVPFQPLIIYLVLIGCWSLYASIKKPGHQA
jgi:hypothetical protein